MPLLPAIACILQQYNLVWSEEPTMKQAQVDAGVCGVISCALEVRYICAPATCGELVAMEAALS